VSPTTPFLKSDVVRNPIKVINGHADVPSGPGLGVEVDEDALAEFVR
jgi:L-alanine-DL-glutamate epimerase-like enolase superfamily enzyme